MTRLFKSIYSSFNKYIQSDFEVQNIIRDQKKGIRYSACLQGAKICLFDLITLFSSFIFIAWTKITSHCFCSLLSLFSFILNIASSWFNMNIQPSVMFLSICSFTSTFTVSPINGFSICADCSWAVWSETDLSASFSLPCSSVFFQMCVKTQIYLPSFTFSYV